MNPEIAQEYKAKIREFIAREGRPVKFEKQWSHADDDDVSPYGWSDWDKAWHVLGGIGGKGPKCRWIVPEGAELYERSYSQFQDTFTSNKDEVGVNVTGCHCACGEYDDVTLRWTGTVTDMLQDLLGIRETPRMVL